MTQSGTLTLSLSINNGMTGDKLLAIHLTHASTPHVHDLHHLNRQRYMHRLKLQQL
jgi:hypothetical protein